MAEGHILKFLNKQQSSTRTAKIFRPQETYGHSTQSPEWFKRKFSLQAKGGYEYKFDDSKYRQKYIYLSQKNQLRINNQQAQKFNQQIIGKNVIHNLKKGLLSQYLDKNSWMKKTIPLNGYQRSEQARKINNSERQKNIQTMRIKKSAYIASNTASNFYSSNYAKLKSNKNHREIKTSHGERLNKNIRSSKNPQLLDKITSQLSQSEIKSSHQRSKSISLFTGQKQKIRIQRNQMAFNKIHKIQKINFQDSFNHKKFRTIDSNFVQQRMTLTARQWGQGRQISPHKSIQRFDTMIRNTSTISSRNNTINRGLIGKNYSGPLNEDQFAYNFKNNSLMSSQL